jgi:hypothetical protein
LISDIFQEGNLNPVDKTGKQDFMTELFYSNSDALLLDGL